MDNNHYSNRIGKRCKITNPYLLNYIKRKVNEGLPLEEIREGLTGLGKNPADIEQAIADHLKENHGPEHPDSDPLSKKDGLAERPVEGHLTKLSSLTLLFIILMLVIASVTAIYHLFGSQTSKFIYITSALLLLKAVVYALVLYMIIMISDYKRIQPFSKCFLVGIIIVLFASIPIPIIRYVIVAVITLMIFTLMFDTTRKAGIVFALLVVFAEIFIGVGIPLLQDVFSDPGEADLVPEGTHCTPYKQADQYNRGYINTGRGNFMDFCTTHQDLSSKYKVESCSGEGCFVVEYTCYLFQAGTRLINCTQGCERGVCTRHRD